MPQDSTFETKLLLHVFRERDSFHSSNLQIRHLNNDLEHLKTYRKRRVGLVEPP